MTAAFKAGVLDGDIDRAKSKPSEKLRGVVKHVNQTVLLMVTPSQYLPKREALKRRVTQMRISQSGSLSKLLLDVDDSMDARGSVHSGHSGPKNDECEEPVDEGNDLG